MSLQQLIPVLQIAIGPVILISGIGLLLLSMTNRFGRVIDRTRSLVQERELVVTKPTAEKEIKVLLKRAHILRTAIALSVVSVLLASLLIIVLFISAILQLALAGVITALFITCMLCLISALILFIADINLSLTALKLEIRDQSAPTKGSL
jgi:uncharacterized protein DUF2721